MKRSAIGIICVSFAVMLVGCQNAKSRAVEGGVIGGVLGAAAGGIIGHQGHHGGEGAAIGAAVGATAGALIGAQIEKPDTAATADAPANQTGATQTDSQ
ncbi:MAG: glycine zipper 2TM domain-containing protein [Candidatus Omnitrophica bacterium]|nr:glycine zipper 2TM domain-containing protein [Candidatus Omnitrophota bacterium]